MKDKTKDKPPQTVWKYPLELTKEPQRIVLTTGASFVHAAWFQGKPVLWFLIQPDNPPRDHWVQIAATGQQMPAYPEAMYVLTIIQDDTFVWHIFRLANP